MRPNHIHREVAKATGESVGTIPHRGFALLRPVPFERAPPTADYETSFNHLLVSDRPPVRNTAVAKSCPRPVRGA